MGEELQSNRKVVLGTIDRQLNSETSRSIRKVMEVIERYTNYEELDADRKAIVRDTVLNQINRLVRVAKHKQTMNFSSEK